jgi:hypothetical protein
VMATFHREGCPNLPIKHMVRSCQLCSVLLSANEW